jgi:hypothetical protein
LFFLFLYLNGFQPPKAGKVNSIDRHLRLRSCRLVRHKKRPLLTTHKGRVLPHTIVLVQTADSAAVKVNLIGMSIAGRVGFVKAKRTLRFFLNRKLVHRLLGLLCADGFESF